MAEIKEYQVPETRAMLSAFVAIFGALYDGTKNLSNANLLQVPLVQIGATRKVDYVNDRGEIKFYRTFGMNTNGQIDETYPSLWSYVLKFDTVAMYVNEFFEQFGYGPEDIGYQYKPAIIQLVLKRPAVLPQKTLTFAGVWFQNNPTKWDAEADDLLVTREINAKASKVIPS
jgi:hypothetical protein